MFYYRRRLPGSACAEVTVSLGTRHYGEAEHLGEALEEALSLVPGGRARGEVAWPAPGWHGRGEVCGAVESPEEF